MILFYIHVLAKPHHKWNHWYVLTLVKEDKVDLNKMMEKLKKMQYRNAKQSE